MALVRTNLSYLGGPGKAPRLWSYTSPDTLATVAGAGYFVPAYQQFQVGDFIFVRAANATAVATDMVMYCITVVNSTTVTLVAKSA